MGLSHYKIVSTKSSPKSYVASVLHEAAGNDYLVFTPSTLSSVAACSLFCTLKVDNYGFGRQTREVLELELLQGKITFR
jgi:hypothetical protein